MFELLWRGWLRERANARLFDAVTVTLDRMCQGGIYDHLGGGFARYATDNEWLIPHFEKMLYDNAQLIDLLTLVWQETRSPLYATRIAETCDWVLREMVGARAAASPRPTTPTARASRASSMSGTKPRSMPSSAPMRPSSSRSTTSRRRQLGASHDPPPQPPAALLDDAEEQRLAGLRAKLKAVRDKRVWPGWDDKVLADWNGLMIAALANAAAVFQRDDWLAAAVRAWRFVMDRMRDEDGRLFHSHRAGKRLHRGTLDDYANMARAGIALFEVTGETRYLDEAKALVAVLDRHFADPEAGGYFITADDAADLIVRNKHCHDNAVPAGNGTLVGVFARLWVLTGEAAWHDKARRQVAAFAGELEGNFFPLMTLLNGYELLQSATELVIVGEPDDPATEALRRAVYGKSLPNKIVRRLAPGTPLPPRHPAAGKGLVGGKPALYVCRNMTCRRRSSIRHSLSFA